MKKVIVNFLLVCLQALPAMACTIFIGSDGKIVLVGNNEDYNPNMKSFLWVRPAENNKNGYVFWGFEEKYPEGGMNDKGLFYDVAALPEKVDFIKDSSKPDFEGYIVEKILQECSSVNDVIKLVSKYNLTWQDKSQIMIADKTGDYAIINAAYILHRTDKNYVLTNYNLNDPENQNFKCWRRNTAYQLLSTNPISIELFAKILDKTSQRETDNATVYSQVCDLTSNTIYLYQRHDFSQVKRIGLSQLLKKGRQDIEITNLFPKSINNQMIKMYETKGIDKTISFYKSERKVNSSKYAFREVDLLDFGYQLLDSNRISDAIKIFSLNLKYYPNSDKANAALANAYFKEDKTDDANQFYAKVSELNPSNFYLNLFGKQKDSITFKIQGMQGAEKISLVGTFNNYDPKVNLFIKHGDEWSCTVKIPKGKYAYKFCVDDRYWIQDPSNQLHIKPKEWWDSYLKVQ